MIDVGVQVCVNNVSPLDVPKRENSLTVTSSAAVSCVTLLIASALREATSVEQLFHGTIVAGTLTAGSPFPLSSLPPFSDEQDETDGAAAEMLQRLRPRNGKSKMSKKALISINKLFHALNDKRALTRPLAPDVSIIAAAASFDSIAINELKTKLILKLKLNQLKR